VGRGVGVAGTEVGWDVEPARHCSGTGGRVRPLVEIILALSDALTASDIPHAFGGAPALCDRPEDSADIGAVVEAAGVADPEDVRRGLVELLGLQDPHVGRRSQLTGEVPVAQ
jgi:hypothetical protein